MFESVTGVGETVQDGGQWSGAEVDAFSKCRVGVVSECPGGAVVEEESCLVGANAKCVALCGGVCVGKDESEVGFVLSGSYLIKSAGAVVEGVLQGMAELFGSGIIQSELTGILQSVAEDLESDAGVFVRGDFFEISV